MRALDYRAASTTQASQRSHERNEWVRMASDMHTLAFARPPCHISKRPSKFHEWKNDLVATISRIICSYGLLPYV